MIRPLITLRRFLRDQRGTATIEFVMLAPLLVGLLVFSIELGMLTVRSAMLERGLDIAVREVRLGTGTAPEHDEIKDIICENAVIIPECATRLRLEMIPNDLRNFVTLDPTPDCTDAAEPAKPLRTPFNLGAANQLMVLRACLKYRPLFPEGMLGSVLVSIADGSGDVALTTMSAFVQEPI
jgi:Flp pilus assembly pilin Flp